MPLTIEQIRAAHRQLPRKEVDCPDLGGAVSVRALTLKEVREIQDQQEKKVRPVDVTRKIVEFAACNEDGTPLFVGEDKALIDALPWGAINLMAESAMELSGMKPGAREDAEKN